MAKVFGATSSEGLFGLLICIVQYMCW